MDVLRRRLRRSAAYSAARSARLGLRRLRDGDRALPDFLIIGAHKGGTSSFYENLVTHPQVAPALLKEVHYFDRDPRPPLAWYKAHFPTRAELRERESICGEATPSYSLHPDIAKDVKVAIPGVKAVFLLRDPVKRAYSAYQFNARRGGMELSFEQWIERDFQIIGGRKVDRQVFRDCLRSDGKVENVPVALLRGIYIEQVRSWHEALGRDRLAIVDSAAYFRDPPAMLGEIATSHLGLPPHRFVYRKTHHETRGYPEMAPATRARLEAFYRPYNEALYAYLGRDFGW